MKKVLILGHGYTADYLKAHIQEKSPSTQVLLTSRSGHSDIQFDLHDPSSWRNLKPVDATLWTFPAAGKGLTRGFIESFKETLGKIVVVGTTSAFITRTADEIVTEQSPLDLEKERVQSEVEIQNQGGCIVFSSGIYGPGSNPLAWVKLGRVGRSDKYVNFIHVEDLAQILWSAVEKGQPSERYIASDNNPHRWSALITQWEREFLLQVPEEATQSRRSSKIVNSSWTLNQLGINLKYPSVLEGVRALDHE